MASPLVNWNQDECHIMLNPRLPIQERNQIKNAITSLKNNNYIWLQSSGTESYKQGAKLVALRREAILHAAASVNQYYDVKSDDVWLNPLPLFHVGGLAIAARCYLAKAREESFAEWNPQEFVEALTTRSVTLSSLVPTQVYDLVQANLECPSSVRLILVGGGPMDMKLFARAKEWGWPLIPSYGMTETAALMAGASLQSLRSNEFPSIQILPHAQFHAVGERFAIQSKCLYSGFLWVYGAQDSVWQPRPEPFLLDDRLEIQGDVLKVLGRETEFVKILGESVNLHALTEKLKAFFKEAFVIHPRKHDRKGYELHLVIENPSCSYDVDQINQGLLPFERIKSIRSVDCFPKSPLGKIKKSELFAKLSEDPVP